MTLTFYYSPMSTASITVDVLAELGTPCDRVQLNIQAGDTRKPDFVRLNPNGRVPVIVHHGTPIWESAAITMYLGETFGVDAGLYPPPGPRRGEAMKWITWANVTLAEAAGRLSHALQPGTGGAVEPGSRDDLPKEHNAERKAREDLDSRLRILETGLDGRQFLLGDYTLADTHLQSLVGWLTFMSVDLTALPNLQAWLKRCHDRPAIKAMLAAEMEAVEG